MKACFWCYYLVFPRTMVLDTHCLSDDTQLIHNNKKQQQILQPNILRS